MMLVLGLMLPGASNAAASAAQRWPELKNPIHWILQGNQIRGGGCSYHYPDVEREIPERGWVLRSIAVDMATCTKVMEEGSPTWPLLADGGDAAVSGTETTQTLEPIFNPRAASPVAAATSTRGAWQTVWWRDILGLPVNRDTTQINWTYDGSTVLSGSTGGYWWYANTGWNLTAHTVTQGFFSGAFRGQTTATFQNSVFCGSGTTVYTFYYYNRVWGHANGTATIAQTSDSVNECLALHVDIWTGYGQWPP